MIHQIYTALQICMATDNQPIFTFYISGNKKRYPPLVGVGILDNYQYETN